MFNWFMYKRVKLNFDLRQIRVWTSLLCSKGKVTQTVTFTSIPNIYFCTFDIELKTGKNETAISSRFPLAQAVRCLATDASLTADPGVASLIPAQAHTFMEIDHEIISTVILLPSDESFKRGCRQLQAKVCARSTG